MALQSHKDKDNQQLSHKISSYMHDLVTYSSLARSIQGLYSGGYVLKIPEGASVNGRYEVNYLKVYSKV